MTKVTSQGNWVTVCKPPRHCLTVSPPNPSSQSHPVLVGSRAVANHLEATTRFRLALKVTVTNLEYQKLRTTVFLNAVMLDLILPPKYLSLMGQNFLMSHPVRSRFSSTFAILHEPGFKLCVRVTGSRWPRAPKCAASSDRTRLTDFPLDCAISEALAWIGRAQDHSASADGGVARHYCLVNGWSTSYPETTGYIIPTVIREARVCGDTRFAGSGQRMLDWLVGIQMPSGAFQGGTVTDSPVVPVTFNTGQILMGLAAGVSEFGSELSGCDGPCGGLAGKYPGRRWLLAESFQPICRAGREDLRCARFMGIVRSCPHRIGPRLCGSGHAERVLGPDPPEPGRLVCPLLSDRPGDPLSHTIGYVCVAWLKVYLFSGDKKFLVSRRAAEGVLGALQPDGFIPGRMDSSWRGTVSWALPDRYRADRDMLVSAIPGNRRYSFPRCSAHR